MGISKALEEGDIGALKDFGKACFTKQVKCSILRFGCQRERRKQEKTQNINYLEEKKLTCNLKNLGMISH